LTTHLALISTHLPALKSEGEEDPLFDDDWAAAVPLYNCQSSPTGNFKSVAKGKGNEPSRFPPQDGTGPSYSSRPPVALLVICVGRNVIFDPSAEEIAAAETIVAITIAESQALGNEVEDGGRSLSLRALRFIDPPARMSQPGSAMDGRVDDQGVWKPPKGGVKMEVITRMVKMVLEKGGVGDEILGGLEAVIDV
jgi:exosome complex component RRP42